MVLKSESFTEKLREGVRELTPQEADAIIATGGNVMNVEYSKEYEHQKHRQLQFLLNKLHGK